MRLHNLPKDMLVQLVAEIQYKKEKEYSEYIMIHVDKEDIPGVDPTEPEAYHFETEEELKIFILLTLVPYKDRSFFENENIWIFLKDCTSSLDARKYCKNKLHIFPLDELIGLTKKFSDRYIFIKGKVITKNGYLIPPLY